MVASQQAVDQIITIVLKHMDRKTALKMTRELYFRVKGSQSVIETFHRLVMAMEEREEE